MSIAFSPNSDDFAILNVPAIFRQDEQLLSKNWRLLQAQVHPDNFINSDAATKRTAMQWSVRINEAYQRLKDPIKRAIYLCQINGLDVDLERNTIMPPQFLMQQMQWREGIDEAQSIEQLEQLKKEVKQEQDLCFAQLEQLIDQQQNFTKALEQINILMFLKQFFREFEQRKQQLSN